MIVVIQDTRRRILIHRRVSGVVEHLDAVRKLVVERSKPDRACFSNLSVGAEVVTIGVPERPLPVLRRYTGVRDACTTRRTNGSGTGIRRISGRAFLVVIAENVHVLRLGSPR